MTDDPGDPLSDPLAPGDSPSMRWRSLLLSGGAALGAAMTLNAYARQGVAPLQNLLGGEEGSFDWRGYDIAYTVRGQGPALLFVHGIHTAAWSYEWRNNVDVLAEEGRHTVFALDLLGFGRSDRPACRYSARLYMGLIADFAARVVAEPCTLVGRGLTAAYAIVLGARDPGRFPSLVLVEPTGLVRHNDGPTMTQDVQRMAAGVPVFGTAMFNAMASRRALAAYLEEAYADDGLVTDEMVDIHHAAAHQPGAKFAAAALAARQLNVDVRRALRRLTQPALLVWGEQAVHTPLEDARGFLALHPEFELAILDPSGDLPHEERPDEFNEIVRAFLTRHPARSGG